jgi:branched-chain amino acid transport system ATP-binding protein
MADPVLEARGISKRFGALVANEDVTLDLRPGEIHAVIGPNGAGKSTLIAQICGALRPDSGAVRLAGAEITGLSVAQRARLGLARTFQISALAMEDSVLENAVLGALGATGSPWRFWRAALSRAAMVERAEAALARVGLSEARHRRVSDLSHGQRRQLEVAVALTLGPRAFVMDEPMAGLGTEGSADLTRLLDALRFEAPILLVEHDMDAVFALADRISVLVYGRVLMTGTVAEVRASAEVRATYLGDSA